MTAEPAAQERLGELALLVAELCGDDPTFGATRLNKALFLSDHLHYKRHGAAITGATYERLPRAPAPRDILSTLASLVAAGDARSEQRDHLGHIQRRLIPLRPARRDSFGATELALTTQVCDALRGHSHASVLGWQLAEEREEIPYPTAFLSSITPHQDDIARGLWLAEERGLLSSGTGARRHGAERGVRSVAWECDAQPVTAGYPRGAEVLAGITWAVARWPDGVHRIPGTRLHQVKTQWPVPALAGWFTLEDETRSTLWAVDQVQPYTPEEDGTD